jgi:CCDC81-like prokaryotic HU domain 1/CCDC81-like prokaryotic HU domain 2
MAIDVTAYLKDLLYQYNAVIIPNFGGFVTTPTSASIDYARGIVSPPNKEISFNENLIINDGYLINYIRNRHGITAQEARLVVENFVQSMRDILNNNEAIILPEIGKLYCDYQKRLSFTQDKTNFNAYTFGLPNIQSQPILRNRETVVAPKPATPTVAVNTVAPTAVSDTTAKSEVATPPKRIATPARTSFLFSRMDGFLQDNVPAILVGGLFLIALSFLLMRDKKTTDVATSVKVENVHVNESPLKDETELNSTEKENTETNANPKENTNASSKIDDTTPNTNANHVGTTEKSVSNEAVHSKIEGNRKCIMIVGSFQEKANLRTIARKIERAGYTVFQKKANGTTKIGAIFNYAQPRDKAKKIQRIQQTFGADAWEMH